MIRILLSTRLGERRWTQADLAPPWLSWQQENKRPRANALVPFNLL